MVAALRLENIAPFRLRPSPQEARGPIPTSNWLIPVRTLMHCSTYTHHVSILNYVCPEPVLVNRRVSQDNVILRTKSPAVSSNRMVGNVARTGARVSRQLPRHAHPPRRLRRQWWERNGRETAALLARNGYGRARKLKNGWRFFVLQLPAADGREALPALLPELP